MILKVHNYSTHVEYWYDNTPRVWYAMAVNNNGEQVSVTDDAYNRSQILLACEELAKECGDKPADTDQGGLLSMWCDEGRQSLEDSIALVNCTD